MSTKVSFQAFAKAASDAANSSISGITQGRYNIYISAFLHNISTSLVTANFCAVLDVNGDNTAFDTIALRSWSQGVKMLAGNSILQVQGSIEVVFNTPTNYVSSRSYLNTGSVISSNYNNQHIMLITKKFNET